jgi:uncharacterized membrane protein
MISIILLIQFMSTCFMMGLIWLVQIVHYPLFAHVGEEGFKEYEARHQRLVLGVVGPVMSVELVTAAFLAWHPPTAGTASWLRAGFVLVLLIWCSTALVQSRQHGELARGFSRSVMNSLVRWNWVRTVAWTVRGVILLAVVYKLLAVETI